MHVLIDKYKFYYYDILKMSLSTVWKVSKYGPEKTLYLHTFHAVTILRSLATLLTIVFT